MKWLLILTGLIVLLLILVPLFMILVGYKVNNDSGEVAEIAAREGNIELCDKIINYGIFGPPSDESRMHCVYRYASLTKDPSACDLLMPSSYGWSCLGAARKKGEICSINYNKYVEWWIESVYEDPQKATMEECKQDSVKSEKGEKCCHILLLTSEEDINDCSRFKGDDPFNDLCLAQLASKIKDVSICNGIVNDNAREICEISVKYK